MEQFSANTTCAPNPTTLATKLANRAKLLRDQVIDATPSEKRFQFLAFNSGRQKYGIPLSDVLEIQALQYFSPVPKTPAFIPGVIHWRGAILTLLDLDRLFGLPQSGLPDLHAYVIAEAAGRRVGLIAGEIEEVYAIPRGRLQSAPSMPGNIPAEWIIGIHENQRLILNTASLLQDPRLVEWRNNS